jgi:hypothetical protein
MRIASSVRGDPRPGRALRRPGAPHQRTNARGEIETVPPLRVPGARGKRRSARVLRADVHGVDGKLHQFLATLPAAYRLALRREFMRVTVFRFDPTAAR